MGIEVQGENIQSNTAAAPQPSVSTFTAAPAGAMMGGNDFLSLNSKLGITRIDSSVQPYLEETMKLVRDNLTNATLMSMVKTSNCYCVRHDGADGCAYLFGIQFVQTTDPVGTSKAPASLRLSNLNEELKNLFAGKPYKLVDARIIFAGYAPEMQRAPIMADTIVRMIQVSSDPSVREATVKALASNEFVVSWDITSARQYEESLSPHAVRPRMEIAATFRAKIKNDSLARELRDFDNEYPLLGVIGGYVEIYDKSPTPTPNGGSELRYQPVFNITVCNAPIALEGVAVILMAAFAPTIYNTEHYLKQWADTSDGQPDPGNLDENPETRGRPFMLKSQEERIEFVRERFRPPVIVYQVQDGRDAIPGMWRMFDTDPTYSNIFVDRILNFFEAQATERPNFVISNFVGKRFEGVYGDRGGQLNDSRNIDYLHIAATVGWSAIDKPMRNTLLTVSQNPTDRANLVQQVTNSFFPAALTSLSVINPQFFDWVVNKADRARLVIVDPDRRDVGLSIGSFTTGFSSPTGLRSMISYGIENRGLNLGGFQIFR